MFLERISNFLIKNKKKIAFYAIFTFILFMISGDFTFASTAQEDATKWTKIINDILMGLVSIVGIFTYFVTMLLDPNFTSGNLFGIHNKLHTIWILVSNIVYFVFAFILIWIAFMNIIGKSDSKWELKQAMPKFIVGVFIVPFSWFIVTIVVAISNLLTISALSLPADTFPQYKEKLDTITIQQNCTINLFSSGSTSSTNGSSNNSEKSKGKKKDDVKQGFSCTGDKLPLSDSIKNSAFGLISSYTFGLMNIQDTSNVNKGMIIDGLKTLGDVFMYLIFNSLFILVYGILLITLAIVLLVRGIYLWLYLALSPLFGLAYFFGKDSNFELFKKFNFTEFLSLAMVPVYTVLALSFGFLFLNITMVGLSATGNVSQDTKTTSSKSYSIKNNVITINNVLKDNTTGKEKPVTLTLKGPIFGQYKGNSKAGTFAASIAKLGLGAIGAIFLNIFGITILRIAVMSALQASTITKTIVAPIKQFGDSVGSLVSKAPTYAPVFGVGKNAQSMASLQTAGSNIANSFSSSQMQKGSKFAQKFITNSELDKKANDIANRVASTAQDAIKNTKDIFALGKAKDLADSGAAIDAIITQLTKFLNNNNNGLEPNNKTKLEGYIKKLKEAKGNPVKLKDSLVNINNILPPKYKLFNNNITKSKVNDYLGTAQSVSATPSSETTKNLKTSNIDPDKGTGKMIIGGHTTLDITVNKDGEITGIPVAFLTDLAKNISTMDKEEFESYHFSENFIKEKLKKYFKDGKYTSDGKSNGIFPWEEKKEEKKK